jgi:hypothetical protein
MDRSGHQNILAWFGFRLSKSIHPTIARGCLVACLFSSSAHGGDLEESAAQALFDQARALMSNGHYGEACGKLVESQRLAPAGGTLINLGYCYERAGKTASAWQVYHSALEQAIRDGNREREKIAKKRIDALESNLCWLAVVVPLSVRVQGLEILVDGVALKLPAWGSRIPLDPGEHKFEAHAPGYQTWTSAIAVQQGQSTINISKLVPTVLPSAIQIPVPVPNESHDEGWSGQKTVGWLFTGTGVATLAAAGVFSLRARSQWDQRNLHCPENRCDSEAVTAASDAKASAVIATGALALGLLEIGAGAYLVVSAVPSKPNQGISAVMIGGVF